MNKVEKIKERLFVALQANTIEIIDDSFSHHGHNSNKGSHFTISVISTAFAGKSIIQRHRMIYSAVEDLIQCGEIHALSIKSAITPE